MSPHTTCSFQGHLSSNHKVFQISSCGAEQNVFILLYSLALESLPCVFFPHCHRYCLSICLSKSSQCWKMSSELVSSTRIIADHPGLFLSQAPPTSDWHWSNIFLCHYFLVTSLPTSSISTSPWIPTVYRHGPLQKESNIEQIRHRYRLVGEGDGNWFFLLIK